MASIEKHEINKDKPTLLLISHTPLVAHFFFRGHIAELKKKFNVILAHNTNLDTFCNSLDDLCKVEKISIQRKISLWKDIWCVFQLIRLIIKYGPKIVISVTPKAGLLGTFVARFLKITHRVHIFQGEVWPNRTGLIRKILMFCDWFITRNSTHLLCVSHSEKSLLESTFKIKSGKLNVLGKGTICGVKPQFFNFKINENKINSQKIKDIKKCIYLGRVCEEKGIRVLISAFGKLNHSRREKRLIIVGPEENFSLANELMLLPEEIKDLVSVHPYTDRPEFLLSEADFLCLPSYREGFGLTILEAAAMGIPAVGTRIVGIVDSIVENETGLICKPKSSVELCESMEKMFEDDGLRLRLGKNAQIRAEKYFRQSKVVSLYSQYIGSLF